MRMGVGIRELKSRLSEYVARAAGGEVIVVTDRGRPVAELTPHRTVTLPPQVADLIQKGLVILPSKPMSLPALGASMRSGASLCEILLENRRVDHLL